MCSGAILVYQIPKVVIGENRNFRGAEDLLQAKGVGITLPNDQECFNLLKAFITKNPDLWFEDIGTEQSEIE